MKLPEITWPKTWIDWLEAIYSGVLSGIVLSLWIFLMGSYLIVIGMALLYMKETGLFSDNTIRLLGLYFKVTLWLMIVAPCLLSWGYLYKLIKSSRIKREAGTLREGLSYD